MPPCQPTAQCALNSSPARSYAPAVHTHCNTGLTSTTVTVILWQLHIWLHFSQHTLEITAYDAINHDTMVMYSVPCVYQVCALNSVAFYAQNCVIWFTQGVAPVWHRHAIYSLRCCSLPLPSTFFFPQLSVCWEYHHCTLHHGNHFL